jgi:hypothetical protein
MANKRLAKEEEWIYMWPPLTREDKLNHNSLRLRASKREEEEEKKHGMQIRERKEQFRIEMENLHSAECGGRWQGKHLRLLEPNIGWLADHTTASKSETTCHKKRTTRSIVSTTTQQSQNEGQQSSKI